MLRRGIINCTEISVATSSDFNPRPSSVFRHLPQCRGGGDPPGVSKLSVVELSGKTSGLLSTSTRDW